MKRTAFTLLLLYGFLTNTYAASVWNETDDGDLSSDPAAPTSVSFAIGENLVSGSVSNAGDVRDYITFTLESNQQLDALRLLRYEDLNVGGNGNRGYHSLNLGSTSLIPSGENTGSFMGGDHLDWSPAGNDILPDLGSGGLTGGGFSRPLGAGTYTYLIQQTGPELTGYSLDFVVSAVPEPSGSLLVAFVAITALFVRPRRSN